MGTFRIRKNITIIPGVLRLNASGSASRGRGARGGSSWTWHLGKLVSYNTRTGRWSVNPPGPGSWQSGTRTQRQAAKARRKAERDAWRAQERRRWTEHFAQQDQRQSAPVRAPERQAHPARSGQRAAPDSRPQPLWPWKTEAERDAAVARVRAQRAAGIDPSVAAGEALANWGLDPSTTTAPEPSQMTAERWGLLTREERTEHARSVGLCGARTRDGSPCMNYASGCPHH
jgi:hypothetical protein